MERKRITFYTTTRTAERSFIRAGMANGGEYYSLAVLSSLTLTP